MGVKRIWIWRSDTSSDITVLQKRLISCHGAYLESSWRTQSEVWYKKGESAGKRCLLMYTMFCFYFILSSLHLKKD